MVNNDFAQPAPQKRGRTAALVSMICGGIALILTLLPYIKGELFLLLWSGFGFFIFAAIIAAIVAACQRNFKGALYGAATIVLAIVVLACSVKNYVGAAEESMEHLAETQQE